LLKQNKPRTFWREVLQSYERTKLGMVIATRSRGRNWGTGDSVRT
jgi:hypothetical protein